MNDGILNTLITQ